MTLRSVCGICLNGITGMRNRMLNLLDPPIIVLIYHRVTSLPSDPQLLAVAPDNFLSQINHIKDSFPVLRFEGDWTRINGPSVVITFDDGYADNVLEALPILEGADVPATFFVSTDGLGSSREFWWDDLERIILKGVAFPDSFVLRDARFGRCWPTRNSSERNILYQEIHPLIKQIDAARREGWLKQLRDWACIAEEGRASHRVMTCNELKKLASSRLATIGAHSASHAPLIALSCDDQKREIIESKRRLEELTGREIAVFSYPFGGKRDYNRETVRLCHDSGYVRAASNFPGQVHRWTDPFQMPRHLVRNWPLDVFRRKLKEFFYR